MKTDFTELLNAIPHGIVVLDMKLCIVTINRFFEGMIGYNNEDVTGIYSDFIVRSNLGNNHEIFNKVLAEGQSVSIKGNVISRGRKKKPIQFTISRLHDRQQNPTGILIFLEDISVLQAKKSDLQGEDEEFGILGHSRQMEEVFGLMSILARTDASVLITGETGTGKDKIAEQLHRLSQRGRKPFIKVNCGALPAALLESELFGHVKGAFTGAVNDSIGMFRLADKGTIFLTEIGDLSLPLQVKLLSVLDDQAFYPVGGSKKIEIDVRIIAATHRSLRQEVKQGRFREDLFYRLNVLHLHIPPLRERDGDILLLLDHFLRQFRAKLAKEITGFTRKTIDKLNRYHYPGNVRELRNIVEYAITICQGRKIGTKDLPQYLSKPTKLPRATPADIVASSPATLAPPEQTAEPGTGGWTEIEKNKIINALHRADGNRSKAADLLGWSRTTLWRKIKKFKLT